MLILTRNKTQKVIINDREVIIEVLSINNNQVKLGFQAENNIQINREEIFKKMQENRFQNHSDSSTQ